MELLKDFRGFKGDFNRVSRCFERGYKPFQRVVKDISKLFSRVYFEGSLNKFHDISGGFR